MKYMHTLLFQIDDNLMEKVRDGIQAETDTIIRSEILWLLVRKMILVTLGWHSKAVLAMTIISNKWAPEIGIITMIICRDSIINNDIVVV